MNRKRLLLLVLLLVAALPVLARGPDARPPAPPPPAPPDSWLPDILALSESDRAVLPLKQAVRIVAQRFRGRVIAARITTPTPPERARGVLLVHEIRLLTPARDVLLVRLDAQTGAFLEVAGSGLTAARRTGEQR